MTDSAKQTWHFWVAGRVQGVCYRMNTQDEARRLGLQGWVRNLTDGRVEATASGSVDALEQLEAWLHKGPQLSRVDSVQRIIEDYTVYQGFEIR